MTPPQTVEVGAASIRVWRLGTGRPTLYLHGFEGHPGAAPFLHHLAAGRAIIAPEHPGFGDSTGLAELHDITDQSLHLRRLLQVLQTGPVDVIGHCLGGMFAAELAALSPHLVRRLVLVDAYGLWNDAAPLPDAFSLPPDALRAAKFPGPPPDEPAAPATEPATLRARNLGAATKFLWPIPDRGLARRAGFIEAPTLVLHGAADGLVPPPYGQALAALIPNARFHPIPAAGHLPMLDAEPEFRAAIQAFLD